MKFYSLLFSLIFSITLYAESFQKGAGSEFSLESNGVKSKLNIYITDSSFGKLGVEYFFDIGSGIFGKQMWQQYYLSLNENKEIGILAGYFKVPELSTPEKLTSEYYSKNKGVKLEGFLFSDRKELEKYKVGSSAVEVPAGVVFATHYRKKENGQQVDFWISEKVKPIGLVKLVSKGKEKAQNYKIELQSLLRNVKASINPKEAKDLSEKGRSFLPK